MSTALRLFWPNFFKALIATLAAIIVLAWVSAAFAQDAPAVAVNAGVETLFDQVLKSFEAGVCAAVVWLIAHYLPWLNADREKKLTDEASTWEPYVEKAIHMLVPMVRKATGLDPEKITTLADKNGYIRAFVRFLNEHNADIPAWYGRTVGAVIEKHLLRLNPNLPGEPLDGPGAADAMEPSAQGFMTAPPRPKGQPNQGRFVPPAPPRRRGEAVRPLQ